MSEYTKGPWVWRGKDGGLYQEGTTHRFGDAVLVPSYEYDSGIDTIVSDADMALIAAAPELLEALKLLHAHVFGPTTSMLRHEIDDLCRSALSKANTETTK